MTLPARASGHRAELRVRNEEGPVPGRRDQFRCRLAHRVNVVPAQRVVFPVGIIPLPILVALVAGDDDDGAIQLRPPHGLQQMRGADHVSLERGERFGIRAPHQRLRSQVEDHFRLDPLHGIGQALQMTDIAENLAGKGSGLDDLVEIGLRGRRQADAPDLGAELLQPKGEPAAFEAGMAGYKHPLAAVKAVKHLPDLPRGFAALPQVGQQLLLAVGVHALPKAQVPVGGDLARCR